MNPSNRPKDLKFMSVLEGTSPNDLMEMSVEWAWIDSWWKWELKGYITKKNKVDNRSLTRTQDKGYWPQKKVISSKSTTRPKDKNVLKESHLNSNQFKSVIGQGKIMDDHSTSVWDTKKHVKNMRHVIQRGFMDNNNIPPPSHESYTRGDSKFIQQT